MSRPAGSLALLAVLAATGACGPQPDQPAGIVAVHDPWARETVPGVAVSGAFGRIENGTRSDMRLTGATTDVAGRVEVHSMTMEGEVMRMRPVVGGLPIRAGETAELRPGSYHIMLMELRRPLRRGETIPITLRFDGAPPVTANFTVRGATDALQGGHHE